MAQIAQKILIFAFFFQAPILFYLKHRFKWQIHHALLGAFCLLLGWFVVFCLAFTIGPDTPAEDSPRQFALIIALICGGFMSGALLLFWSPVIIFFSVKNRKIKLAMSVVFLAFISLIGVAHFSDRYDWGVPGNQLIHSGSTRTGFDGCSMLVFEAENDLLKQKMVRKWKLKPMSAYWGRSHPISFAAIGKDKPDWWPSEEGLESLEGYGFIHDSDELYRSLWYDPNSQRLYLERGNW